MIRVLWIASVLALACSAAASANTDLTGRVVNDSGAPLAGVSVFVYTARPRVGTSPYCPSCYADCGKFRTTERDGQFVVPALSDSLIFRLLAVGDGWEPTFVEGVDPSHGDVTIRLRRPRAATSDPKHLIHGRVLDPRGKPVVGATLAPFGWFKGDLNSTRYSAMFGRIPETDPLCVTDRKGRFALTVGDTGVTWFVLVKARDLAPLQWRTPAGAAPATVRMKTGAIVTGRVLNNGEPMPNVVVGLGQAVRWSQAMAYGHEEIATNESGVYTFSNVTPNDDYLVYGTMSGMRGLGAIDTSRVRVGSDRSIVRAEPIDLHSARRIAGQVTLADGSRLPANTRIIISRDPAWDAQTIVVDADGRFVADGIPNEEVELVVRVRGYALSSQSDGYTPNNGYPRALAAAGRDYENFRIVLEPEKKP